MSIKEHLIRKQKAKDLRIFYNTGSLIIILIALGWGIIRYFHLYDKEYTNDAQVEEYISPINTCISGYIKAINFEEYQQVKQGDTLVVIDDREYKIRLEQALAQLKEAQAGKEIVLSDRKIAENSTDISVANINALKAQFDNQETNLQRYKNLLKNDVIPQYQYDEEQAKYNELQAKYNSLLHQQKATKLNTQSVSVKLHSSEARILNAQAQVDMARLNRSYCYITAPFDGIVGRRKITIGQLLQPGQAILSIVQANSKWVTANYTESQIEHIHIGQLMRMRVDAIKGVSFEGKVVAISGATGSKYSIVPVDNSTGNFIKVQQRIPVKIIFTANNKQEYLDKIRAGMNVQITKKK